MKQFWFALIVLFISGSVQGQVLTPVKWEMSQEAVGSNEYQLTFKATVEDGWNIYSQYLESEDGPVATTFNFDEGDHLNSWERLKNQTTAKRSTIRFLKWM